MLIIQAANVGEQDRSQEFEDFALRRAEGKVVLPPTLLPSYERRLHVRNTLREDHGYRIRQRPEGAQLKFDTLADDVFSFFRGSALLYYRDYAGTDGHLPIVLCIGDVHPENFGSMPSEDNVPIFGANDFDEACWAPFTYDVKRGAVGFAIISRENGLSKKKQKKVVRSWIKGYLEGLKVFLMGDRERWHQFRIDNSPSLIQDLLEGAMQKRKPFLEKKIDLEHLTFRPTHKVVPRGSAVEKFQQIVDEYVEENGVMRSIWPDDFFTVKDVAVKKGSGTASLGLDRYWILVKGRSERPEDCVILEMKQARRSAIYGLTPPVDLDNDGKADQTVRAQQIHLVGGDPLYGSAEIDGMSFLVRERSPYKDDIDVDDLSYKEMKRYAHICGQALALCHARSDEDTNLEEGEVERRILSAITPRLFRHDIFRFVDAAVSRIYKDYKMFRSDHRAGAFNFIDPSG